MEPKRKQSSLLTFFKKPTSTSAAKDSVHQQPEVQKGADVDNAQDVNEAVIGPSSPHADEGKGPMSSTVVSPAAAEENADAAGSQSPGAVNVKVTENEEETAGTNIDDASVSGSTSEASNESESESDNEASTTPKKSDYELLRERNIARNNERLKSLGLLSNAPEPKQVVKKKPVKRKKAEGNADRVSYPTRRSTRMRKAVLDDDGFDQEMAEVAQMQDQPEEIEEEQFTVSALFEYNMSETSPFSEFAYKAESVVTGASNCKNLVPSGPSLIPPSGLNALYSLQFYPHTWENSINDDSYTKISPSWLVGAGKAGIVALWDCRKPEEEDSDGVNPVVSWKAHGGRWIADAKFIPAGSTSMNENETSHIPKRLLTAANDGTICHWDLTSNSIKTGAPKLLGQTDKSLHASGIFSMDVRVDKSGAHIASGSKDKTIVLSSVERLGDAYWRSDFHSAKVGCVSLSTCGTDPLIVSASDDGYVAVHDSRSDSVSIQVENSHFKPHSAIWRPGSDSVFLTAGLDETIKLWDTRNVSRPLASFHGHVPKTGKRLKRIHRPAFVAIASESYILSGGEGSHSLSMFQLSNFSGDGSVHSVFNRGRLPDDHGDVGSLAVMNNHVAVAGVGGEVLILA